MLTDYILLMKSEVLLTITIFIILFGKLLSDEEATDSTRQNSKLMNWVNGLLILNFVSGFIGNTTGNLFGDMFMTSPLISFEKNILMLGTIIVSLTSAHWIRTHKHAFEFYILLLSSLLGMYFMLSSGNLMMFYMGLELSTIPLAALVNFDLDKRRSSESAMKMIMMSAFASCIILLGISFIYGITGSLNLQSIALSFGESPLSIYALILVIAGFGFKISAVPFHLWTADVYEGAPSGITAFLSVVSKGSVIFVMTSVLFSAFSPVEDVWYQALFIMAILTMVIGNLFAIRQTNIKRMLAFSSIAQVGFILIGMSSGNEAGEASVIYFILIYLFSNLGAFGVISVISSLTGKENITDYSGLYKSNPFLSWVMAISLFSLAGIPPAAGFFAKFFLLFAGAAKENYPLIIIAALNMVVALYYYLVVVKVIFTGKDAEPIPNLRTGLMASAGLILCVAGVIIAGIYGGVYQYINNLVL